MLSQSEKTFYAENGYLLVEDVVPRDMLVGMQQVTEDFIDRSRNITASDDIYDLDKGHSAVAPRLTRIKLPHKRHPLFHELLWKSPVTQVLTDLLGPDTLLNTSKLNTKAPGGGAAVEWHQDWAFYPHTNDSLLALGVFLEDVTEENGPLLVVPGSHRGPLLSHHRDGVFAGAIDPEDDLFEPSKAVTLTGRAGSMSVHHVRTLHGSAPNTSDAARKILFYECLAADAWPLAGNSSYISQLGQEALIADLNDRLITGSICLKPRVEQTPISVPLPPPPDATSIFKVQQSAGARSAFR